MKNKTAVEYLEDQFEKFVAWFEGDPASGEFTLNDMYKAFHQAIELEKQQIITARSTAPLIPFFSETSYIEEAEQYYLETYKTPETDDFVQD